MARRPLMSDFPNRAPNCGWRLLAGCWVFGEDMTSQNRFQDALTCLLLIPCTQLPGVNRGDILYIMVSGPPAWSSGCGGVWLPLLWIWHCVRCKPSCDGSNSWPKTALLFWNSAWGMRCCMSVLSVAVRTLFLTSSSYPSLSVIMKQSWEQGQKPTSPPSWL